MGKKLTDEQVASFHRDGFLSPVDIFSQEEATRLRLALEEAEKKWPEAFEGSARNNAHYNIMVLDEITHNKVLVDAVEDLIGPDILNCGTVLFIKEAHDPGFVSWHQDGRYMGLDPLVGVTAWVALSPATEVSGCMAMVPGSHKQMQEHQDTYGEENILTRGQEIANVDEASAVLTPLQPGQVSFHSQTVIHSSKPNQSNDRRIGFAIQSYIPPHMVQTLGRTHAQLVRGTDPFDNFDRTHRPQRNMNASDVEMRDHVNDVWSDVLYHGAEKRRNY